MIKTNDCIIIHKLVELNYTAKEGRKGLTTELENEMQVMAAKIAHEIKNPLAILKANVQLLELEDNNESHKRNYGVMNTEINRINHLILEFIQISKPHKYQFEKVDVILLFQEILLCMDAELKYKNITLTYTASKDQMFVLADSEKLKEAFINILQNAAEAVDIGGEIHSAIFKSEQLITIKVEDNGKGIPQKYIDYIGKPFFTTKKGGSGLGVSISKKIIEDHKGTLSIASIEGKGSTVSMTLPEWKQTST